MARFPYLDEHPEHGADSIEDATDTNGWHPSLALRQTYPDRKLVQGPFPLRRNILTMMLRIIIKPQ